jgi:transposase-like protein
MIRRKEFPEKQKVISEYLSTEQTFEQLGQKYDLAPRTIQSWVRAFRKRSGIDTSEGSQTDKSDVAALKKQLEEAQLKNELLEEMLRLSFQQTGVDIRKKYGTRQS